MAQSGYLKDINNEILYPRTMSDLISTSGQTNLFVTSTDKDNWNNKRTKHFTASGDTQTLAQWYASIGSPDALGPCTLYHSYSGPSSAVTCIFWIAYVYYSAPTFHHHFRFMYVGLGATPHVYDVDIERYGSNTLQSILGNPTSHNATVLNFDSAPTPGSVKLLESGTIHNFVSMKAATTLPIGISNLTNVGDKRKYYLRIHHGGSMTGASCYFGMVEAYGRYEVTTVYHLLNGSGNTCTSFTYQSQSPSAGRPFEYLDIVVTLTRSSNTQIKMRVDGLGYYEKSVGSDYVLSACIIDAETTVTVYDPNVFHSGGLYLGGSGSTEFNVMWHELPLDE